MVQVIITTSLEKDINRLFKKESIKIIKLMMSLEENPRKGKLLASVGSLVLKELKYKSFRFYFVTNGYKIKFMKADQIKDVLIKFVRMSDKKDQQKVIEEIKHILRTLGSEGFD